jgi:hypothetical protein
MTADFARGATAAALALLAAACTPATTATKPAAAAPVRVYAPAGLEGVMGRTAAHIEGQFGRADLDIREGTARKLQFAGPVCVLDAYLYPRAGGGDPVVTHIDARLPDGRDFDRASCIAALTRREEAR